MNQPDKIVESWIANANNWIATIDNTEIESRKLCTNGAIVNTILSFSVNTILDIGCGEGWLTRELRKQGKQSYGVDVVPALIENAIAKDGDYYQVVSYGEISKGVKLMLTSFDAVVINFALIDKDSTASLIKSLHRYLTKDGMVFIQTLHPAAITDEYVSGWKEGSWNGMKRDFTQPYQWYFRTLSDWLNLFKEAGLNMIEIKEPVHPETKRPLSVIFVLNSGS
jgi:2-polyprenyl-3-methyl-5-hydroxy-6-metoxy-1,4-benzoquinol methylase